MRRVLLNKVLFSSTVRRCFSNISPAYEISEKYGKGKVLVATRDILPGSVLFEEKPLLSFTSSEADRYQRHEASGIPRQGWIAHEKFMTLDEPHQKNYFSLWSPTDGKTAKDVHHVITSQFKHNEMFNDESEMLKEAEKFVKIYMAFYYNNFGTEDGGHAVYETISRMSHSCDSNCCLDFTRDATKRAVICVVKKPVKIGEELTLTYSPTMDLNPTHVRREFYMRSKDFLCDCPRCSAIGDDTRQFSCVDTNCSGIHYANQHDSSDFPHLLPCTICNQIHPHERDVFKMEERYSENKQQLAIAIKNNLSEHQTSNFVYPTSHLQTAHAMVDIIQTDRRPAYQMAFTKMLVNGYDNLHLGVNHEHARVYKFAAESFVHINKVGECTSLAKHYSQSALRMKKILHGRECTDLYDTEVVVQSALEKYTRDKSQQLEHVNVKETCMFCGETECNAEMPTARSCPRCDGMYCSTRCQKAHWSLHNKQCVA